MSLKNYAIPFVLFALLASPQAYKFVRGIAGSWVANAEGLASVPGLLLHALVFVLIVGFFMRRVSGYSTMDQVDDQANERLQKNRFLN
jgi:hypothetical protein